MNEGERLSGWGRVVRLILFRGGASYAGRRRRNRAHAGDEDARGRAGRRKWSAKTER